MIKTAKKKSKGKGKNMDVHPFKIVIGTILSIALFVLVIYGIPTIGYKLNHPRKRPPATRVTLNMFLTMIHAESASSSTFPARSYTTISRMGMIARDLLVPANILILRDMTISYTK